MIKEILNLQKIWFTNKQVIVGRKELLKNQTEAFTGEGKLIDSERFTGFIKYKSKKKIIYHFEQNSLGKKKLILN